MKVNIDSRIVDLMRLVDQFGDDDDKSRLLDLIELFPREERAQVALDAGIEGYSDSYVAGWGGSTFTTSVTDRAMDKLYEEKS